MNVSLRRLLEIFALLLVIIATPLAWHFARGDYVRKEWLIERLTVAEAEARHTLPPEDERVKLSPNLRKPFGGKSEEWESLKRQIRAGDELWTWGSPLAGRRRDGAGAQWKGGCLVLGLDTLSVRPI